MTTYYVCHGFGTVQYVELKEDRAFGTGLPNTETFTDESAARARAEELGWVFPEPEEDFSKLLIVED
tara:strand:- start:155 stop:355 length:201 start_codon:yes stop_codon:yes gene_type:complete